MAKYRARPGGILKDDEANVVGREMDAMCHEEVPVTGHTVVERASSSRSPLHKFFDWDDESAASKQRVEWARLLIRSVMEVDLKTRKLGRHSYNVIYEQTEEREYVKRKVIKKGGSEQNQVQKSFYQRIVSVIDEVEAFGFERTDRAWKAIVTAVRTHRPTAADLPET